MEHEAGVEPAWFGFKAQRGYRQPTARVCLDQAAGIGPARAWFRAKLGYQQPTPELYWQAASESNGASKVLETSHRPAGDL